MSVCPVRPLSFLLHTPLLYLPVAPSFVHSFIPSVGTADWDVVGADNGFFAEFSGICDTPEILREWTRILCSSEERVLSFLQTLRGAGDPKRLGTTERDGNCCILKQMASPFGRQAV